VGNAGLVERLRAGDRAAFAEVYGDYADRIFGLCVTILRDADEAADTTHDVFVVALQRVGQLRDPDRLRPWLFAIARHLCFRRLKERDRTAPVAPDEIVLPDVVDELQQQDIDADEAAALVWAAAGGLPDRDRTLLSLSLNEGLEGADLVAALGIEHANPYSLLHRAQARLDAAVSVVLVARLGRRDCDELRGLLGGWDGTLTPPLRKRLGRHVDGCATCQATNARGRKLATLSSLALVAPAARAEALPADELLEIASRTPVASERWLPDGFPPGLDRSGRRRRLALVAAALGVVGVVVLVFGLAAGGEGGRSPQLDPHAPAPTSTPHVAVEGITAHVSTTTSSSPSSTTTTTRRGTTPVTRTGGGGAIAPPASGRGGGDGGSSPTTQPRIVLGPPASVARPPVTTPPPTTPPPTIPPKTTTTLGET
jgi:RNA polymerase sigma factor (sigma-70 family)